METKEYRTLDRSKWPSGAWDDEPDKMQWADPETGLPCLAVRNWSGAWCGYVGVAEGHPHFGKNYDDVPAEVHCGLTFSDACQPAAVEARGICHVPGPGEPDHVWWLGFDCAHCYDYSPRDAERARDEGGIWALTHDVEYRTLRYVRNQCAQLARQFKEAAAP